MRYRNGRMRPTCWTCESHEHKGFYVESDRRKFDLVKVGALMAKVGEPPVRFGSTAAYRRYLKRQGLTDDLTNKEIGDRVMDTGFRKGIQQQAVKQVVQQMFSTRRG